MYERKSQPLAPLRVFYQRVLKNILFACSILAACLIIGIIGYRYTAGAQWIDAIHNASMILSGMGPVIEIKTNGGKIFSSFYALFSGVVFITNIGVILAPLMHRLYHRLHLEEDATS
jgi:ABC-type phosphate transport system permease subunit